MKGTNLKSRCNATHPPGGSAAPDDDGTAGASVASRAGDVGEAPALVSGAYV
jgi:hypothetical protein